MKRHPEFVSRQVADRFVIVPVGTAAEKFSGMITINATGKFLWDLLENEQTLDSLAQALVKEYEIDMELALKDTKTFLEPILPTGAIIE
jgi:hypothetical protein